MNIDLLTFSCKLGGLEQVFVDYCDALAREGHQVRAIIHRDAAIRPALERLPISIKAIGNLGLWDISTMIRLKALFKENKPDCAIAHGNRAVSFLRRSHQKQFPIIGVNHSYNIKRAIGMDAVIAITLDMQERYIQAGQPRDQVFINYNMVDVPSETPAASVTHQPVVIGTMGRFVEKKGFDDLIEALAYVKESGIPFQAIIAGDGELRGALEEKTKEFKVAEEIHFPGWVTDKEQFFNSIDIFCFPSRTDVNGKDDVCPIVVLEALSHGKAMILTDTKGPKELITSGHDAYLVSQHNPQALAQAIITLVTDQELANQLGERAYVSARDRFSKQIGGKRLTDIVRQVICVKEKLIA